MRPTGHNSVVHKHGSVRPRRKSTVIRITIDDPKPDHTQYRLHFTRAEIDPRAERDEMFLAFEAEDQWKR
jgi:hypothetical protein